MWIHFSLTIKFHFYGSQLNNFSNLPQTCDKNWWKYLIKIKSTNQFESFLRYVSSLAVSYIESWSQSQLLSIEQNERKNIDIQLFFFVFWDKINEKRSHKLILFGKKQLLLRSNLMKIEFNHFFFLSVKKKKKKVFHGNSHFVW